MEMEQQPIRISDIFNNDLYQFTCSYAYFKQNKHQQIATFDIFFRKYPFQGQYLIFAGLQSFKIFLKNFSFTARHQLYLKKLFPHFQSQYFQWLKQDFSSRITIRCMNQGEIVFANQPIISYTGPLAFVQLLETPSLNLIGFASLVASNASRMVKAVCPKKCMQFGTRRAQGPDGALSAAQYSYIGGFEGTSNVMCARKFQMPCFGTMSHAYVTSFSSLNDITPCSEDGINLKQKVLKKKKQYDFKTHQGELASFLNFAIAFPNNFTTLIDTFSTLQSGILNTIIVAGALIQNGIKNIGIRLDSGDLGYYSKQCRKIWNKYFPQVSLNIIASDDLYEQRLIQLMDQKCQIDIFAIGTNIATCKKQPALGIVCKLVQLNGVPKMKLSSSPQKATYPCKKNVYRVVTQDQQIFDLISLQEQKLQEDKQIKIGTIKDSNIQIKHIKKIRLINPQINKNHKKIDQIKFYVENSKQQLPNQIFLLKDPSPYKVYMTSKYLQIFHQTHFKATSFLNKQTLSLNKPLLDVQNYQKILKK